MSLMVFAIFRGFFNSEGSRLFRTDYTILAASYSESAFTNPDIIPFHSFGIYRHGLAAQNDVLGVREHRTKHR